MAEKGLSPERIIQELAAIAFAKVPDCMVIEGNEVRLKEKLKPAQRVAIASVERSSTGIKVKFYDKMKALELLGKHFGFFEGKEDTQSNEKNLLEAILTATRQEVDTDGVSELQ